MRQTVWEEGAPRGSDALLCGDVENALRATGRIDLRHVGITARDGAVRLHGRVPTYYLKQLAQAAVLQVSGVQGLENAVDVW